MNLISAFFSLLCFLSFNCRPVNLFVVPIWNAVKDYGSCYLPMSSEPDVPEQFPHINSLLEGLSIYTSVLVLQPIDTVLKALGIEIERVSPNILEFILGFLQANDETNKITIKVTLKQQVFAIGLGLFALLLLYLIIYYIISRKEYKKPEENFDVKLLKMGKTLYKESRLNLKETYPQYNNNGCTHTGDQNL